jgi:hypothetical protein
VSATQPQPLVITPWLVALSNTTATEQQPNGDAAINNQRHEQFRIHVLQTIQSTYPWLLTLVDLTGSRVLANQGGLWLVTPDAPETPVAIPELAMQLLLLPWREDDQPAQ